MPAQRLKHEPFERPVQHAHAAGITRTEDEVRIPRGFQEIRDFVRVMGKIAVHLEDEFVISFQSPFEPGKVGAAQPVFFLLVQDMKLRVLRGKFVRDFSRAVR